MIKDRAVRSAAFATMPSRYLGAEIVSWEWLTNMDAAAVIVVGMSGPLIVSGVAICAAAGEQERRHVQA